MQQSTQARDVDGTDQLSMESKGEGRENGEELRETFNLTCCISRELPGPCQPGGS